MMSRLLTRREQIVLAFLAIALVTGSITIFALRRSAPASPPLVVETTAPAPRVPSAPAVPATEATGPEGPREPEKIEIVVSVQGAVRRPGVYRVDPSLRIHDLIEAAGGLQAGASTADINLAARLIDGTTLTIPLLRESVDGEIVEVAEASNPDAYTLSGQSASNAASTSGAASGAASGPTRIDLNRATQSELELLPGIGPKLAEQIIQYRAAQPFRDISELMDVSGIGPGRFEAVREMITVD